MKTTPLFLSPIAILFVALGCSKDPVSPPPPEDELREPTEIIDNIVVSLEKADSISVFVDKLKELPLTAADVEEGITVFAPLNPEETVVRQALLMDKGPVAEVLETDELTPTVMKDHIVKGVIKLADLTDGLLLTSLSGKKLKISREGNKIWINGIQIGSEEIGATADQIIYTVKQLLSGTTVEDELQTTTLEVLVWDASTITPESENGTLAAGATVRLYNSHADFANETIAYEAQTGVEGKAVFSGIVPGTYFVGVEYENKSNIFHASLQNGVYVGLASAGIFRSEADILDAPGQYDGVIGNFKWRDTNADDTITMADLVPLPFESANVNDGRIKAIEVFVGYSDNSAYKPLTPQAFEEWLAGVHVGVGNWQREMAVLDAALAGVVMPDTLHPVLASKFSWAGSFSFTPTEPMINQLWQSGYNIVRVLNELESRAPQSADLGTLRLLRGYTYLQLMHYFGNIPLITVENQLNTPGNLGSDLTNSDPEAVYDFIISELQQAAAQLPQRAGTGAVAKGTAQALLARAALFKGDYQTAATLTEEIISSGVYALADNVSQIFRPGGPEIIWLPTESMKMEMLRFFGYRPLWPIIRYTEVLLMHAEALVALDRGDEAAQICNQLDLRRGLSPSIPPGQEASADQVQSLWRYEMPMDGKRFLNLVRWGKANEVLGWKGYTEGTHHVLPIPKAVLDANPNMSPTPGY